MTHNKKANWHDLVPLWCASGASSTHSYFKLPACTSNIIWCCCWAARESTGIQMKLLQRSSSISRVSARLCFSSNIINHRWTSILQLKPLFSIKILLQSFQQSTAIAKPIWQRSVLMCINQHLVLFVRLKGSHIHIHMLHNFSAPFRLWFFIHCIVQAHSRQPQLLSTALIKPLQSLHSVLPNNRLELMEYWRVYGARIGA